MQRAQAILAGSRLHALIDKVVVGVVAHSVRVIDDDDKRRRVGHVIKIPYIDGVAILAATPYGNCFFLFF